MSYNDKNTWLKKIKNAPILKNDEIIKQLVLNKNVLDVGCVGQDHSPDNPDWLHKKIVSWARKARGVDINTISINELKQRGYDLVHIDDIEQSEDKYEIINISHVIEHVDDLVKFLNFYKKLLITGGKIIIGTPNPFNIRQFFSIFLYGKPSVNPEHTTHLDPIVILELLNRANLKIVDFYWSYELSKPRNKREKILFPLFKLFSKWRKFYSANYVVILS